MYLKRLEIQGYKTFASRCEFVFEPGVTAIVGPNGSGKSNVADSIRWVLGEQSYRLLRGKKTEDMIFAGSQKRTRAGLAQATIVLDNSDGALNLDFTEVAIGRRAYRSGENEYLLNGSRVRLRDIVEVLSSSGLGQRTYNVIGQGLIDAALSLRADERRALFEEAAGIALYKERRQESLSRLEETLRNLERVEDILSEIRPRMRRLERQAARSREFAQVSADLENLLYLWYGYHWQQAKIQLREARQEADEQAANLARVRQEQSGLENKMAESRRDAHGLRNRLGDWHRDNSELHRQAEKLQRNLAVHTERRRLLGQQQEELDAELGPLQRQVDDAAGQLHQAQEELDQAEERWQGQQQKVKQSRRLLNERRQQVNQLREQEQKSQRDAVRLESQLATTQQQKLDAGREQQRLAAEVETTQDTLEQELASQEASQSELQRQQSSLQEIEQKLGELEDARGSLWNKRQSITTEVETLRQQQNTARARVAEATALYRTLDDLRARGVGHQNAVQKLLADPERPAGIIAPVAQLLQVPPHVEQAIAAVLEADLSSLVVEDQTAAEAILDHPAVGEGRITLLPLADLRPPEPPSAPDADGVLGLALDHVTCEEPYRPLLHTLLGRVVLVRDRATALRIAPTLPVGCKAVTLDGLTVAHDGRIVKPGQESGESILAQEREWRMLPDRIAGATAEQESADAALAAAQEQLSVLDDQLQQIDTLARELRTRQQSADKVREKTALQLDRITQNIAWLRRQIVDTEKRAASQQQQASKLDQRLEEIHQRRQQVDGRRKELQDQLARLPLNELSRELATLERSLAQTEGARRNQQTLVDTQRRSMRQFENQLQTRSERIKAIAAEREQLQQDIAQEQQQERELGQKIAAVSQQIAPAEKQLRTVEAQLEELRAADEAIKRRMRIAEQADNRTQIVLDRKESDLEHLRTRIQDELGLVNLPLDEDISGQTPLPMSEVVGYLPLVQELPLGLEESVQKRKLQLKRMGPINPDAPIEFDELKSRHTFLQEQVSDLRATDAKLRKVIEELDEVMEREFKRTFKAVAAEFKLAFSRLFGGGSARLILTDPDNPVQSGVEIIARPPGRRQQGLALLSGGERSLTAAALVFSLLKVSPTPFCVLDEVDAMLDEANVGRFRDMLAELSQQTQFIVITHNRGTVQAADTIYGVSMGDDGVTQVISLKLEGDTLSEK